MATVETARLANPTSGSPTQRQLRALRRNPIAMLGLVITLFWAFAALSAPHIGLRDPLAQKIGDRLKPPSSEYWFGTDELGRDVFSRVVYGARISLPIGFIVILFAMTFGCLIGASAGYFGGVYDLLIMRLADITMAFPSIVLALAIAAVLGPSITNALIAMILVWWPEYARLMRSQVLSVKTTNMSPPRSRWEARKCGLFFSTSCRTPLRQFWSRLHWTPAASFSTSPR